MFRGSRAMVLGRGPLVTRSCRPRAGCDFAGEFSVDGHLQVSHADHVLTTQGSASSAARRPTPCPVPSTLTPASPRASPACRSRAARRLPVRCRQLWRHRLAPFPGAAARRAMPCRCAAGNAFRSRGSLPFHEYIRCDCFITLRYVYRKEHIMVEVMYWSHDPSAYVGRGSWTDTSAPSESGQVQRGTVLLPPGQGGHGAG